MSGWSVYVIRCADDSLYTGISTDVERRLRQHANGPRGAKYLKGRAPFELVFTRPVGDRSRASRVEHRLKRLSKEDKERLVRNPAVFSQHIDGLLAGDGS